MFDMFHIYKYYDTLANADDDLVVDEAYLSISDRTSSPTELVLTNAAICSAIYFETK